MEVMHAQKAPIFCQALAEPPQGVGAAAVQGTRWRARMGQLKVSLKLKKLICISYNWSLLFLLLFYLDSFSSGHRKVFKELVSSCVLLYQGRYRCNILPALTPIIPQPFFSSPFLQSLSKLIIPQPPLRRTKQSLHIRKQTHSLQLKHEDSVLREPLLHWQVTATLPLMGYTDTHTI